MPRVVHFEIQAGDPDRAIKFYQTLFGWTFQKWEGPMPYWLITTGPDDKPGINGGLLPRQGPAPIEGQAVNAYVCTTEVESIDASIKAAESNGGSIAVPKKPVPGIGWLAYCKDTEGNIFGMMQSDTDAK
ncbi:MAG TPA: VOC family protein [Pyrinomonadaceae bacterium]|nr:VOC family protein [Pyrinomonadaceae bacterium]